MNNPESQDVFEVRPESFQTDVVERSQQVPVVLLFWAGQVPPSADALRELQAMMPQYQGKVALGTVDVSQDQTLAQHLRVQGLPSIRVVSGGQIAQQLDGPQTQPALRELLDNLTMSSADVLKSQLQQLLATKDYATATAMLQQAINEEPNNMAFRVELADILARQGSLDDARTVLASINDDTPERSRPEGRLELAEQAATLESAEALSARVTADPSDLDALYGVAIHAAVADEFETALDACMTIVQTDRKFRDDIGRTTMLKLFDVLGKGDPLAGTYRRRLFAFMH